MGVVFNTTNVSSQEYTNKFRTKTYLIERPNITYEGKWGIAMDVGYSSTKIFSPNMVASFPTFVKKVAEGTIDSAFGGLTRSIIAYKDETGEYLVGEAAQDRVSMRETDNIAESAIRNRYYSIEFLVSSRVGMALGMQDNQYGYVGDSEIYLQTGLPPEYMADKADLIDALAGTHTFKIKIGNGAWQSYDFTLPEDHIRVMPQPMGTLISIATNKDGTTHKSAKDYFSKKMLIFDAGYGTLDVFYLNKHTLDAPKCKTFSHYGMLAVMQECVKILKEAPYEKEISLTALQQVLEDGSFRGKFDRKTRSSGILDFAPILKEANEKIAREALNTIDEVYNCLTDEDYLVVTGGTGIAWLPFIKEYYGNIEGLTILIGSQGDDLPEIFANVRGYYFNLLNSFRSKA